MEKGKNGDAKLCPSILSEKTRPPSSLGRLFIVTGLVGSRCLQIMLLS
jgi:hypothetical protein